MKQIRGNLETLDKRAEALEAELKQIKDAVRKKKAAKAAREKAQLKKDRTHALILAGLMFLRLLEGTPEQIDATIAGTESYYEGEIKKQENPKTIAKLRREKELLKNLLEQSRPAPEGDQLNPPEIHN